MKDLGFEVSASFSGRPRVMWPGLVTPPRKEQTRHEPTTCDRIQPHARHIKPRNDLNSHTQRSPARASTIRRNPIYPAPASPAITIMASSSPPARPASPSNSFYALSDDEEGEYNTITHTTSGRGVKLLYSKSKVCWVASAKNNQFFAYGDRHRTTLTPTSTGLRTPHSLCKRQYTRIHCSPSTETSAGLPTHFLLIHNWEI